jgi:hypothetical protein
MKKYYLRAALGAALFFCCHFAMAQVNSIVMVQGKSGWHGLDLKRLFGSNNTATGIGALNAVTTGSQNVADGFWAMYNCTTCGSSAAVGAYALYGNTGGGFNTAMGFSALDANQGSNNTAVGANSMAAQGGNHNTAVGASSLPNGGENYTTAIGYEAIGLSYATTGYNTAIGAYALTGNGPNGGSTGNYNTVSGAYGLNANTTGSGNSVVGAYVLYQNTTGYFNSANGYFAMSANTSGAYNLADGIYALSNNTTGTTNTGVGSFANVGSGGLSNATALGYDAYANSSNSAVIGNTSVTSIGGYANWTNFSDGRYKKNIQQNVPGLAFINKLTPVTYTLDIDGIEAKLHGSEKSPSIQDIPSRSNYLDDSVMKQAMKEKAAITYSGFVAQDVEKAAGAVGYDFSGIDKPKDVTQSFYGLRYGDFVVPLVKAVQELSATSDAMREKFDSLQAQVNELRAMLLAKNTSAMSGASLDQNAPNPFTGSTVIGYSLPKGTSSAKLQITDVNGHVLAIIPLSGGAGKSTLTASLSGRAAGTYMYSLIVDGKLVGTRQMTAMR